ncbi:MAG: PIG-L deacetylase family protein [Chloroflexota bacterium]|nr:PIG-L deacetylase family protein [Chloroflexota bacterium]
MLSCPPVLLAIFAHPDDEAFRCGGTLALLARRGARVWVLCATRGEAGVPGMTAQQAGQVRESELCCSCRALGIKPPIFLDYLDGTLAQVDEEQAVAQVTRIARELRPQILLTWPPDGVSGHPDHVAVSRWTDEAFRRLTDPPLPNNKGDCSNPLALYHLVVPRSLAQALGMDHLRTVPDKAVTLTMDVSAVWESKMAAIRCHRTQMDSSPILSAPEERRRLFLGTEHFRLATSTGPERNPLARFVEH